MIGDIERAHEEPFAGTIQAFIKHHASGGPAN